jgi:hypothetical protein
VDHAETAAIRPDHHHTNTGPRIGHTSSLPVTVRACLVVTGEHPVIDHRRVPDDWKTVVELTDNRAALIDLIDDAVAEWRRSVHAGTVANLEHC